MAHGRHGPPGPPAVQTVCITSAGPAVTLSLGMEVCTARAGTKPALYAREECVEEKWGLTRLKTREQKMVRNPFDAL